MTEIIARYHQSLTAGMLSPSHREILLTARLMDAIFQKLEEIRGPVVEAAFAELRHDA